MKFGPFVNESSGTVEELVSAKSHYETRKMTNRSDATVPDEMVKRIEEGGITIEDLESMRVPVFKYKTQITVHGLFPEIGSGRIGNYKYLVRNANGSLGIKYNAIDHAKKERIYNALDHMGWEIHQTSTEWYAFKSGPLHGDKAAVRADLIEFNKIKESIDMSLFFGSCDLVIFGGAFIGFSAGIILRVSAIYGKNVEKCISNIASRDVAEIEAEIKEKEAAVEQERAAYAAEYDKTKRERDAQAKIIFAEYRKALEAAGFKRVEAEQVRIGNYLRFGGAYGYDTDIRRMVVYKDRSWTRVAYERYEDINAAIADFDQDYRFISGRKYRVFTPLHTIPNMDNPEYWTR